MATEALPPIAAVVQSKMRQKRMTPEDVIRRTSTLRFGTLYKIIRGEVAYPRMDTVKEIADALDMDVRELFEEMEQLGAFRPSADMPDIPGCLAAI